MAAAITRDTYSATLAYRDSAITERASLETKITASTNERVAGGTQSFGDGVGGLAQRALSYPSKDNSINAKGKLGIDLNNSAAFEVGVQLDNVSRDERQIITEALRRETAYKINVFDAAVFGRWMGKWADADVQMGIRREQLSIDYDDSAGQKLSRAFDFIAPQFSWSQQFGHDLPVLNFALTKSIRVPDEYSFSTRTIYSIFNSQSTYASGEPILSGC